ncbi:FAD-binding protein [OM182 bacterium]|jgi:electron transfer flavoprotein alpha subunit|nr:FAD-binding protein [OM182 bacterium]
MKILVIAEHDNTDLNLSSSNAVSAAKELGEDISVLVIGNECREVAESAAHIDGVKEVVLANHEAYKDLLPENLVPLIADLAADVSHIVAPATTFGKNLMPGVAALLDVAQISDVIEIKAPDIFVRPIYAGNAIETVQSADQVKILTVRTTAYPPSSAQDSANITDCDIVKEQSKACFVKEELSVSERPSLTAASIIISGGRGMQNGENFVLLEKVADKLGAAIGASRAAVDAGFVPNDYQVGQTGKIVAPDLYIAVGISGAIQHLAGMKDSKVIVAINKDEEAPIFQVADYGLVTDLFKALPELEAAL